MLDLTDVTFLDSSGLNAILLLSQRVGGRSFVLRNPQEGVAKVFHIVRLADVPGIEIERA